MKTLRSAIAVIPQDPVLFQGSIRFNIDPFNIATDIEVWKVLEEAYLKDKVSRLTNMLNSMFYVSREELSPSIYSRWSETGRGRVWTWLWRRTVTTSQWGRNSSSAWHGHCSGSRSKRIYRFHPTLHRQFYQEQDPAAGRGHGQRGCTH